jgi:restriction system protein
MAIPDFQSLMLPTLLFVAGKQTEVPVRELIDHLASELGVTEEDRRILLPSGRAPQFYNRAQWACTHLRKAGLLEAPRRAFLRITPRGKEVLATKPKRIDMRLLATFPEFQAFRAKRVEGVSMGDSVEASPTKTPLETLESGFLSLRSALADELLDAVRKCSPGFFEKLVIELLLTMGYGGSRLDAGKALGRSGDGGIDGTIKEDRLGLDFVYIQAKRWADKPVGRPEVQQFAGALDGHGAGKGVFLTTSHFTKEAQEYASGLRHAKIVLIDGEELVGLMIDLGIGVSTTVSYEVKRMDTDYFNEGDE